MADYVQKMSDDEGYYEVILTVQIQRKFKVWSHSEMGAIEKASKLNKRYACEETDQQIVDSFAKEI